MIRSFGDKGTEDLFHGRQTSRIRKFPAELVAAALRKLDTLNSAQRLNDLRIPAGNRLEALKGKMKGFFSIRLNEQYRIVFQWEQGDAYAVSILDYH
jgi:proteic killer suppression protein